jgi:HSP20 family protein
MNYIKIRFGEDMADIDAQFQKTVDEMFRMINPRFVNHHNVWRPQIDVYEGSDEIIILAEMSGVKNEDIDIVLGRTTIKISGMRKKPPLSGPTRYRLAEIPYGHFERSFSLPAPIDTERVTATCTDGLLQVRMVKASLDNRLHKIFVKTS